MKVLILGAGGLTGRYLVREAKRRGMEVAALTKQDLDITQSDAARETLAKVKPVLVINAASVTSLETCGENPVLSRKVNCEAPEEWAKECGRAGRCASLILLRIKKRPLREAEAFPLAIHSPIGKIYFWDTKNRSEQHWGCKKIARYMERRPTGGVVISESKITSPDFHA